MDPFHKRMKVGGFTRWCEPRQPCCDPLLVSLVSGKWSSLSPEKNTFKFSVLTWTLKFLMLKELEQTGMGL